MDIQELKEQVKDYIVNNGWVTLKDKEGEPYHVDIDAKEEERRQEKEEKAEKEKTAEKTSDVEKENNKKTADDYKNKLAEYRKKYKILDTDKSSDLFGKQYKLAQEYLKFKENDKDDNKYKDRDKEKINQKIKNLIDEISRTALFRSRQEDKNGTDHGQLRLFNSKAQDIINNAIAQAIADKVLGEL